MIKENLIKGLSAITFKQLRALDAVAATGSFTTAANQMGLTPPAVHSQLRTLEDLVGSELVLKSGRDGMVLTEEGRILQQAQHTIENTLRGSCNQIAAIREGLAGSVVLGVVSTGKYFAPAMVAGVKKAFPNIYITLNIGNRDEIITALHEQSVDLVIMGRPPRSPEVTAIPIGVHPHLIIAPPGHPLAGQPVVSPSELLDEIIISREAGSGTRILMTRYLDRIGEGRSYETMVMNSNETIKQAVIAGLGIALISQHTVTEELKSGRLVALQSPDLPIRRQWFLLRRADNDLSPTTKSVWNFVTEQSGRFFPELEN